VGNTVLLQLGCRLAMLVESCKPDYKRIKGVLTNHSLQVRRSVVPCKCVSQSLSVEEKARTNRNMQTKSLVTVRYETTFKPLARCEYQNCDGTNAIPNPRLPIDDKRAMISLPQAVAEGTELPESESALEGT
jgi:hypothetical protein